MTMKKSEWKILFENKNSDNNSEEKIIKNLLFNRGLNSKKDRDIFLNPENPLDINATEFGIDRKKMHKVINRIKNAQKHKERIVIFGDYDADGICSTAILWEYLYKENKKVMPYLPDRFNEGYGINEDSIDTLKDKYPDLSLIISVDNGISAFRAIEKAKKMSIDFIVLDHHQKQKKLPKALIVHTTKTCAGVISWLLVRELIDSKEKTYIKNLLELSAISAIADQISLIGVNRSIVKWGLEELNKTKRLGLKALFESSGIDLKRKGTYEIGYIVAPRLNAMGRMESALESLRLLCTNNPIVADTLSKRLSQVNMQRQNEVERMTIDAMSRINKENVSNILILEDKNYHEGVIGLVASKLVEKHYRPSIVIAKGEKVSKGSARSINGFNIYEAISSHKHLLISCGGHPMAAGFSIENDKISDFKKALDMFSKDLDKELFNKQIIIDMPINFSDINYKLAEKLDEFEPFGIGNRQPLFLALKVRVVKVKPVGNDGKHLKIVFSKNNIEFNSIVFNAIELFPKIEADLYADIVFYIEKDNWSGFERVQLRIKDIQIIDNYAKN